MGQTQMEMDLSVSIDVFRQRQEVNMPFGGGITLEAGEYWIGDLGYVLSDSDWGRACGNFNGSCVIRLESGDLALLFTTYGDGFFGGGTGSGVGFCVDSGTIGIVPASAVEDERNAGVKLEFSNSFVCQYGEECVILGHVKIPL